MLYRIHGIKWDLQVWRLCASRHPSHMIFDWLLKIKHLLNHSIKTKIKVFIHNVLYTHIVFIFFWTYNGLYLTSSCTQNADQFVGALYSWYFATGMFCRQRSILEWKTVHTAFLNFADIWHFACLAKQVPTAPLGQTHVSVSPGHSESWWQICDQI